MKTRSLLVLLMAGAVLLTVSACKDDDDDGIRPTMFNIWPHVDGAAWSYEMDYAEYVLEKAEKGDGLPSMESLHAALQEPMAGTPTLSETLLYELALDGVITTAPGVEAQRVVETIEPLTPVGGKTAFQRVEKAPRRLLQLIARARPDLRDAVLEILGEGEAVTKVGSRRAPFFIGGYAFAYEDSGYFGYGDIDKDHSWTYLEGRLRTGSRFELQLVKGLTDDIWLYGRIWSVGSRRIDGVPYNNVVECMYVIDLGLQHMTNEDGTILGSFHSYIYANTFFCPTVGPVGGRERHVMATGMVLQDDRETALGTAFDCRFVDVVLPPDDGQGRATTHAGQ